MWDMWGKTEFVGNWGNEGDVGMYDCGRFIRNPTDSSRDFTIWFHLGSVGF